MSYGVWYIEIPLKYCDVCIIQSLAHAKLLDVKVGLCFFVTGTPVYWAECLNIFK